MSNYYVANLGFRLDLKACLRLKQINKWLPLQIKVLHEIIQSYILVNFQIYKNLNEIFLTYKSMKAEIKQMFE